MTIVKDCKVLKTVISYADNYRDDLKKGNITERVAYNELLIAKNKIL